MSWTHFPQIRRLLTFVLCVVDSRAPFLWNLVTLILATDLFPQVQKGPGTRSFTVYPISELLLGRTAQALKVFLVQ